MNILTRVQISINTPIHLRKLGLISPILVQILFFNFFLKLIKFKSVFV